MYMSMSYTYVTFNMSCMVNKNGHFQKLIGKSKKL